MSKKKYLERQYFSNIVRGLLKKDLSLLPGQESNDRCIWSNVEIGKGSFKSGFLSEIFCKGKKLSCLDDFDYFFLKDKVEKLQFFIVVKITLMEFGTEIRREFQMNLERISPVSKQWIVKHTIEHYKIKHLHKEEEDAVQYKAELDSLKSEKIRLLN